MTAKLVVKYCCHTVVTQEDHRLAGMTHEKSYICMCIKILIEGDVTSSCRYELCVQVLKKQYLHVQMSTTSYMTL